MPATSKLHESADSTPETVADPVSNVWSTVVLLSKIISPVTAVPTCNVSEKPARFPSKNLASTTLWPPKFNADIIVASDALFDGTRHRYSAFPRLTGVVSTIPSTPGCNPRDVASACHAPNVPYARLPSTKPMLPPPRFTISRVRTGVISCDVKTTTPCKVAWPVESLDFKIRN